MTEDREQKTGGKRRMVFGLLAAAALVAGGLFLWLTAGPAAVRQISTPRVPPYFQLAEGYTGPEVLASLREVRDDPEYQFYFFLMDPDEARNVFEEVARIMTANRGEQKLRYQIEYLRAQVEQISRLFYFLDYPRRYESFPEDYPELREIMDQFLEKELTLTLVGGVYKAMYSPSFSFDWDRTSYLAAVKLRRLLGAIRARRG
jgi:hypothetical protein